MAAWDWDPLTIFGAVAALLFLGFLGQKIFQKLRFNDTLLLIGVGVALGPALRIIDPATVEPVREIVGPLALILILFDGGLALRFGDILRGFASAASMAVIGFAATAAAVGAVAAWALGIPFTTGLILGSILGGTSALVVMPSLQHIRTEPKTRATLNLESALTDVLVVVVAFTLINIVALGQGLDAQAVSSKIIIVFCMSILFGLLAGLLWLWVVPALHGQKFGYMMTLAWMFSLYVITEWVLAETSAGGGPLAVLAFGIMLGNAGAFGGTLRDRVGPQFVEGLQQFQGEISFLVRTFFFVYLGLLVDPSLLIDPYMLAVGVIILAAMFAARYVAVSMTRRQFRFDRDAHVVLVMMPRGLAAAVLAAVPAAAPYMIPGTESFVALAFMALVGTNLLSTFGALWLESQPEDPGERALRTAAKKAARREAKRQDRAAAKIDRKEAKEAAKAPSARAAAAEAARAVKEAGTRSDLKKKDDRSARRPRRKDRKGDD